MPALTVTDAKVPVNIAVGTNTINSRKYYMSDVNNDSRFTVSDSYYIYAKKSGIKSNWGALPLYRIFNPAEWNIIKTSNSDLRTSYPGVQGILINSPANNGISNFYLLT